MFGHGLLRLVISSFAYFPYLTVCSISFVDFLFAQISRNLPYKFNFSFRYQRTRYVPIQRFDERFLVPLDMPRSNCFT